MKKRNILFNITLFSSISLLVTIATYFFNIWLFSSNKYLREHTRFSPTDAFFLEGVTFLMAGLLLLLGRGGIDLWSQKAAIISALAGALYGEDTVGPNEALRRDRWKPKGFTRLALILILTGVFMILAYFLTL